MTLHTTVLNKSERKNHEYLGRSNCQKENYKLNRQLRQLLILHFLFIRHWVREIQSVKWCFCWFMGEWLFWLFVWLKTRANACDMLYKEHMTGKVTNWRETDHLTMDLKRIMIPWSPWITITFSFRLFFFILQKIFLNTSFSIAKNTSSHWFITSVKYILLGQPSLQKRLLRDF